MKIKIFHHTKEIEKILNENIELIAVNVFFASQNS